MSDNDEEVNEINASVGEIDLCVSGLDEEWVEQTFNDTLETLDRLSEDDDSYHVEAGAGWMFAHASADSPEEAEEVWQGMWERMLDDVEELSYRERETAGLVR